MCITTYDWWMRCVARWVLEVGSEAIQYIPPFSLLLPPPLSSHLSFSHVVSQDASPNLFYLFACILFLCSRASKFVRNIAKKIFCVIVITWSLFLHSHWDFATTSPSSQCLLQLLVITVCLSFTLHRFWWDSDLVSVAKVIPYSTHSDRKGGGPPVPSHTQQIPDLKYIKNFPLISTLL